MAMNAPRVGALVSIAVTVICVLVASVIIGIVSHRYVQRIDLGALGGTRLSERTRSLLAGLEMPVRIVVAADLSIADREGKERLNDVLAELSSAQRQVSTSVIDTGSAAGAQMYHDVLIELIEQHGGELGESAVKVEAVSAAAATLEQFLAGTAAPGLKRLEASLTGTSPADRAARDYFNQSAAAIRVAAKDLADANEQAGQAMKSVLAGRTVPRTDLAAAALAKALPPAAALLESVARELKAFAASASGAATDQTLIAGINTQRDAALVQVDALTRLKRPDLLRVVDALGRASAALVMSPGRGLVAVEVESLLPSAAWLAASGANVSDQHRRVEEILATAVATLRFPDRPIVVIVHGEPREFLSEAPVLSLAKQRLESRGADVIEWACVARAEPPTLVELNKDSRRPVVYVVMSADSASDAGKAQGKGGLTGVQRCERVGKTVASLIAAGKNLCVALNPSVVATYGDKDPIAAALEPMAIGAESGKPLLREQLNGGSRVVVTDLVLQGGESEHPLGASIRGLPTTLPWPVVIKHLPGGEATFVPLLGVPSTMGVWGESQWLSLWQTPRERRGQLSDLPVPDPARDLVPQGTDGPLWVAAAAERTMPGSGRQRVVVVGANSWLIDQVAGRSGVVDGRQVSLSPGNLELLEQTVSYLCGRDELIARTAAATSVAMVQPIDQATLLRTRLVIILGLPALALLVGAALRLWRG